VSSEVHVRGKSRHKASSGVDSFFSLMRSYFCFLSARAGPATAAFLGKSKSAHNPATRGHLDGFVLSSVEATEEQEQREQREQRCASELESAR